jgi:aldehyde:ferredoxin oxidoreductase
LGILAIIIEGIAPLEKWFQLEISAKGAKLVPSTVTGLNNYQAVTKLTETYGKKCAFITIGRAGEFRLSASSIAFTDRDGLPTRHAGRGGVGAVMGSKRLKAIIINPEDSQSLPLQDPVAFKNAANRFVQILLNHPVCGKSLATYGSAVLMGIINEAGALPTRNFTAGQFKNHEALSGEQLNKITLERGGEGKISRSCMNGCVMQCSGIFPDKDGQRIGKWPDFETMWSFGPNTGIDNLDAIARYDRLCDDIGVDTIDVGGAIALLMEANQLQFGDYETALSLVEEIGKGSPIGRVIGSGASITGRVYGLSRIAEVKGQALPAFDPRGVKGQGVTFATNPQGADHTAGFSYAANLLSIGGEVDPLSPDGQVELSRQTQISAAFVDTLGLCLFVSFAFFESPDALIAMTDMLNARYGWKISQKDLDALGKKVLNIELDFNHRAGFNESFDRLPDFFSSETIGPHHTTFDVDNQDLDKVLK